MSGVRQIHPYSRGEPHTSLARLYESEDNLQPRDPRNVTNLAWRLHEALRHSAARVVPVEGMNARSATEAPAHASPERDLVFDVNDFDETHPGRSNGTSSGWRRRS